MKNKPFLNKHHTDETKRKMSERGKEHIGEKNSQYGKCWIMRNGISKTIIKADLDNYLLDGWIKGRKMK